VVALWSQLTSRERRRRWGLILAGVAALAVLGVALVRQRLTPGPVADKPTPAVALEPATQQAAPPKAVAAAEPPTAEAAVAAVVGVIAPEPSPSAAPSASAGLPPKPSAGGGLRKPVADRKGRDSTVTDFGGRR
jgi:hypothetical protein